MNWRHHREPCRCFHVPASFPRQDRENRNFFSFLRASWLLTRGGAAPGDVPSGQRAREMGGRKRCPHGKLDFSCMDCSGCPHRKLKYHCVHCNPCPHGKLKDKCVHCGGCPHRKLKYSCVHCSACPHGNVKYN